MYYGVLIKHSYLYSTEAFRSQIVHTFLLYVCPQPVEEMNNDCPVISTGVVIVALAMHCIKHKLK